MTNSVLWAALNEVKLPNEKKSAFGFTSLFDSQNVVSVSTLQSQKASLISALFSLPLAHGHKNQVCLRVPHICNPDIALYYWPADNATKYNFTSLTLCSVKLS
jgi:hypothetical protein